MSCYHHKVLKAFTAAAAAAAAAFAYLQRYRFYTMPRWLQNVIYGKTGHR